MKIEDFENDLKKSEKTLEYSFLYNVKTYFNRVKYKVVTYKKAAIPFVITSILSLPVLELLDAGKPFTTDEYKVYNYNITNLETNETKNEFVDIKYKSFIKYTTPFVEEDGFYVRYIIYYKLDNIENFKSLDDLKEIKRTAEYKAFIKEDNKDDFEILYYDINEDEYRLVKEKETKNQFVSSIYLTVSILSLIYFIDNALLIKDSNPDIEKLYPYVKKKDVKLLEKKLAMKNKNLEFLKGDTNEDERSK